MANKNHKNNTDSINHTSVAGLLDAPLDNDESSDFGLADASLEPDSGIPSGKATLEELNNAHVNVADIAIPKNVRDTYAAHGWELKWIRYQRPNGSPDHEKVANYRVALGGEFVSLDILKRVDPRYAATLSVGQYKGGAEASKAERIIVRGDLALLMYKSELAKRRRELNSRSTEAALSQSERDARNKGLSVEQFNTRPD